MSVRLFGTDGMRGRVNKYPMTPEVALRLGLAAGTFYRDKNRRSRVVIGKDTRLSGYVFENALAAGLLADGCLSCRPPAHSCDFLSHDQHAGGCGGGHLRVA